MYCHLFIMTGPRHAAQHERAGRKHSQDRSRLYRWLTYGVAASGDGHLTRSRPQNSTSTAAAPQWEPRKPLASTRKPRRSGDSSGAIMVWIWGVVPFRTTHKFRPLRSATQADSDKKGPSAKPGPVVTQSKGGVP